MRRAWRVVGTSAASYVVFANLWHVAANYIGDQHDIVRGLAKGACLLAAGLLFVIVSVLLSAPAPGLGVLRGAIGSASAVAIAAFVLALIEGWRVEWGEGCNQCDPTFWPVAWPVVSGGIAALGGLAIAWLAGAVRRLHVTRRG